MTVETLKKKWLWHYIKPKYFYIPVRDTNNQGIVKFSFYKPTYYESDVFDYVQSVSIIIFKNDIDKTYIIQRSTNNGIINLELPTGDYFMYITSIKGCLITETKYDFQISKNQETELNIYLELANYKIHFGFDDSFTYDMSYDPPIYHNCNNTNSYWENWLIKGDDFDFIEGKGALFLSIYNEKNNYIGKLNFGTTNDFFFTNDSAAGIVPPSFINSLSCLTNVYVKSSVDQSLLYKQRNDFKRELKTYINETTHDNYISCSNDALYINIKMTNVYTRVDTGKITTYIDGSDIKIIDMVTIPQFIPKDFTKNFYSGEDSNGYTIFTTVYPQNIVAPKYPEPLIINYGKNYIYDGNLSPSIMYSISYNAKQTFKIEAGEDVVYPNEHFSIAKTIDNDTVLVSQGNRNFVCDFYDKIQEMIEQGKWID